MLENLPASNIPWEGSEDTPFTQMISTVRVHSEKLTIAYPLDQDWW